MVNFVWKQIQKFNTRDPAQDEEKDIFAEGSVSTKALLLDKGVLERFYDKRIHTTAHEYWRVQEFVEGFSDDLLEDFTSVCDRKADIAVQDCIGVGSVYEFWRTSKPLTCDLMVPFAPPKPYQFSAQLCGGTPAEHCWGRIKIERASENNSCLCGMANLGDDMVCLLHGQNEVAKISDALEDLLCSKHTPYLSKDRVIKWFQNGITKAWEKISHKYEFELTFRNLVSLKVRFRSGMTIIFNITPVIRFQDSNAYFVPQFTSNGDNSADTHWLLSFAVYEKHLLKSLAKSLPENPCHIRCLQIVSFLHKKQTDLTGRSPLSNYHLKTALLHLLLDKRPSEWSSDHLEQRVCDILEFIWKSLHKRELWHVLIGNSQVPKEIALLWIFADLL
ncbi:hypothetical protein AAFF_G00112790 [Aldrovandia affinis]|uniref:Inositol 1,4,5-trisphosphate receptor-interacting protein n=1 Tax=Aldrovandia affinis TaxID=143900 RepID=A0AAD7RT93_9TELE|nr:hypothetical protein AAFF_G00112790 [Aldrovandia affinis]